MKKKEINISYQIARSSNDLNTEDRQVFAEAIKAMNQAYAPYSNFKVGCAVLLESGEIILGNNQENMAYPSGLCAERVALFATAANYAGVPIKTLAVAAQPLSENVDMSITPCGGCRQVMIEYERIQKKPFRIITGGANGKLIILDSPHLLLPFAFYDEGLMK